MKKLYAARNKITGELVLGAGYDPTQNAYRSPGRCRSERVRGNSDLEVVELVQGNIVLDEQNMRDAAVRHKTKYEIIDKIRAYGMVHGSIDNLTDLETILKDV